MDSLSLGHNRFKGCDCHETTQQLGTSYRCCQLKHAQNDCACRRAGRACDPKLCSFHDGTCWSLYSLALTSSTKVSFVQAVRTCKFAEENRKRRSSRSRAFQTVDTGSCPSYHCRTARYAYKGNLTASRLAVLERARPGDYFGSYAGEMFETVTDSWDSNGYGAWKV